MDIWQLLLFIPACFALNMAPGPNNLLAMNNARCYGFRAAFTASLGRIAAFSAMIALSASGLAVILYTSEMLFLAIKLVGALYLLWIAFNLWCSESSPISDLDNSRNYAGLAKQEFTLAAGNPKAILIFTAFLPQFVDANANVQEQFFCPWLDVFDIRNGRHFNLCHLWFVLEALVFKPKNGETFQSRMFVVFSRIRCEFATK